MQTDISESSHFCILILWRFIYIVWLFFLSCVHFGMFFIKKTKRFYSQSIWNLKTLKLYISKLLRLQIEPCNSKMRHLFIYTWPFNTGTLFYLLFFLFIKKLHPLTPALYSIYFSFYLLKNFTL